MSTALVLRQDATLERYMAEVSSYPLLSREEEVALARRFRDENDVAAAHQLVVSNLRFVVKVANRYRGYGLRLLDLVQEGNIGLMHAVKKFDPEKGYRLISYAVWWIRDQIHNYIMRNWSLVKLGTGRARRKLFFKLRSSRSRAEQEAEGDSSGDMTKALANQLGVTEQEVTEMDARMAARDFSLDAPLSAETDSSHLEMLTEEGSDPEQLAGQSEERRLLRAAVDSAKGGLNEKEQYILDHRLLAEEPETLAAIGKRYGFTRERARQLEARLIKKLRSSLEELQPQFAVR